MKRWLPFLFWLLFVGLVILSADQGWFRSFFARVNRIPMGDKLGHFVLIGSLGWLFNRALGYRFIRLGPTRLQLAGLVLAVVMTVEEISQLWFTTRSFSFGDLAANYAGIFAAEMAVRLQLRRRREPGGTTGEPESEAARPPPGT